MVRSYVSKLSVKNSRSTSFNPIRIYRQLTLSTCSCILGQHSFKSDGPPNLTVFAHGRCLQQLFGTARYLSYTFPYPMAWQLRPYHHSRLILNPQVSQWARHQAPSPQIPSPPTYSPWKTWWLGYIGSKARFKICWALWALLCAASKILTSSLSWRRWSQAALLTPTAACW